MCTEDLIIASRVAYILLGLQIILLILSCIRKNIRWRDRGFLLVLSIAHPVIWKGAEDCGEEMWETSFLFLILSVAICGLAMYRAGAEQRIQEEQSSEARAVDDTETPIE